ncbi:hypothetical protein PSQ20_02210 [Curvibacter sp. RS43]|uniref:hypothetical protein n=1 Tax=Curvibacter microcysteis TaxID=3026419 RepID=UPI002360581F|nr:hypothetical protein [Curvibacter sp. RS43]MDD0809138.1 hypothetical protein [Curvibacter sp. RS43]
MRNTLSGRLAWVERWAALAGADQGSGTDVVEASEEYVEAPGKSGEAASTSVLFLALMAVPGSFEPVVAWMAFSAPPVDGGVIGPM